MTNQARRMALGGVLAALAVVLMTMGGMIPVATYVVPMLCMMILKVVASLCGRRTAWAWYGAVTLLGLLLCPDKEAAAVFGALGYYPIVKPGLDKTRFSWLWKGLLFNGSILLLYWILLNLLGVGDLAEEFALMGKAMMAVLLVLGNVVFVLLDLVLGRSFGKKRGV